MRTPKVADFSNVHATEKALHYIKVVNFARARGMSYSDLSEALDLSERTVRRYYWGIHSINEFPSKSREQIRIGASVPIHLARPGFKL